MSGDKRSADLVKFWWVLAATVGAAAGAVAAELWGIAYTFWGIAGVGVPLALAIGFVERSGWRGRRPGALRGPRVRRPGPAPVHHRPGSKSFSRRGKLHAITGRKSTESDQDRDSKIK
jgi:hypothetical protein